MNLSTPGFPVDHRLPEFTQTYVRWISDAIQPSHPLSSPSPPSLNLSQHQGLFQWINSFTGQSAGASALASILPMNSQGWFPLGLTGLISLQSKGLPRVLSRTRVWRHQFFGINTCFGDLFSPSSFSCVASAAVRPILFITVTFLPKDPIWTLYPWSQ